MMKTAWRFIPVLWFSVILYLSLGSVAYAEDTGFILPKGVTVIEDEAFSGCEIMKSVTIPLNVSQIGDDIFFGCVNLTDIYYNGTQEQWEEITKDSSNETFSAVSIHPAVVGDWDNLSWMLDYSGQLTIIGSGDMLGFWNDSIEAWRAFPTDIYSVVIEEGITSIGQQAFSECSNLTSVTIPSSVKTIDREAFYGCGSLKSITIPDSVIKIEAEAFRGSGLTSIIIPASVNNLGWYSFADCGGLTSAGPVGTGCNYEFEWTERIPSNAFSGCNNLTSVTLPESVKTISEYAFDGCSRLTEITLPEGVTGIGERAFSNCGIKNMALPSSLSAISEYCFQGCSALKSVTIPEGVKYIEACAFEGCTSLTSITIPEKAGKIGDAVFRDCSSLTSVTLPKSLTVIGKRAFLNCDCLMNVFFAGTEEEWKNILIDYPGNDRLDEVHVYYNVTGSITAIPIPFYGYHAEFKESYFNDAHPSTASNSDLALLSGILSWAVYNDPDKPSMKSVFYSMGIPSKDIYEPNTTEFHYAIGKKEINVDGELTNLVIICVKGTQPNLNELLADKSWFTTNWLGYTAYESIADFENDVMAGVNYFCGIHPELYEMPLKVLITGHSLGGAAANLLGARFTKFAGGGNWRVPSVSQSDIYVYTFASIDSIQTEKVVASGFENIHNLYNYHDSFGPHGWPELFSAAGCSGHGKFGHIELFYTDVDQGNFGANQNHMMGVYLNAVVNNEVQYENASAQELLDH